jgi:glycosyltransferase involved in cell wall biosynthesis
VSISVVIAAYNASPFIADTLASVLAQTIPINEILVVDDGSADETAEIAQAFGPPVRVIRTARSNQATARNVGIQQASSEWIAFVDADDLWEPNKLARQMQELALHPEAEVCYTGRTDFSMENGEMKFIRTIGGEPVSEMYVSMMGRCSFFPSCVVIRKSTLVALGGFNQDPSWAEDWDLWVRLIQAGIRFACCPEPLLLYRIHPDSETSDSLRWFAKGERVLRGRVLPNLTGISRLRAINRFYGDVGYFTARKLWDVRDRRCIYFLTRSILHQPFTNSYRYRFIARMILTLLTGGFSKRTQAKPFA